MTAILQTTTKMSLKTHTKSLIPQFNPYLTKQTLTKSLKLNPKPFKISCSKEKEIITGEILALELSLQITKIKAQTVLKKEALQKSRELLFMEVSSFMGLESEDCKKKWKRMNEDEKWGFVKGFVAEWSANFHPLSIKSVKEMVEEYLSGEGSVFDEEDVFSLFPDFIKLLGFSRNSE